MPGGDGTGPMGMGSMTGRAAGYCAGYSVPGFMSPARGGFVWGRGRGGGRGRRNRFSAAGWTGWPWSALSLANLEAADVHAASLGWPFGPSAADAKEERDLLKRQAEYLTNTLDEMKKRIEELEAQPQNQ